MIDTLRFRALFLKSSRSPVNRCTRSRRRSDPARLLPLLVPCFYLNLSQVIRFAGFDRQVPSRRARDLASRGAVFDQEIVLQTRDEALHADFAVPVRPNGVEPEVWIQAVG